MYIQTRWVILGLAPLLCARPALSQHDSSTTALQSVFCCWSAKETTSASQAPNDEAQRRTETKPPGLPSWTFVPLVVNAFPPDATHDPEATNRNAANHVELAIEHQRPTPPDDFNRSIFYRNKLEFSLDSGWLPINIPFPFDFMLNSDYNTYPLKYTLVPVIGTLRWQLGNLRGPIILRGNWDLEFSGAVIAIPRGPETRYFSYIMGMRRNFVPRNSRVTPYFDWRIGLGNIDAKGPLGVPYAQGQDFTFTLNMGSGFRYNFSPRYGMTLGLNWMHISNANLSEGSPPNWGYRNYGINVYGPMVGLDVQLRGRRHASE